MKTSFINFERTIRVINLINIIISITGIVLLSLNILNMKTPKKLNMIKLTELQTIEEIKLPDNVKKYFTSERNIEVLNGWIRSIDNNEKRKNFIDKLSSIIDEAEKAGEDIIDVINDYKSKKFEEVSGIQKYEEQIKLATMIGMIIILVIFIILMLYCNVCNRTKYS